MMRLSLPVAQPENATNNTNAGDTLLTPSECPMWRNALLNATPMTCATGNQLSQLSRLGCSFECHSFLPEGTHLKRTMISASFMKTATSMMSLATPAPPVPSFVQKDIMVRDKFLYGMKWNGIVKYGMVWDGTGLGSRSQK